MYTTDPTTDEVASLEAQVKGIDDSHVWLWPAYAKSGDEVAFVELERLSETDLDVLWSNGAR